MHPPGIRGLHEGDSPPRWAGCGRESRRVRGACQRPSRSHCVLTEGSGAVGWYCRPGGATRRGRARTRQADRVRQAAYRPPSTPSHVLLARSRTIWGWRKSGTTESQSPNIRRSPTTLRVVSISATIRRRAPTRQTPQSFGQRRQRHAEGFIQLLEFVQMDLEAARERRTGSRITDKTSGVDTSFP